MTAINAKAFMALSALYRAARDAYKGDIAIITHHSGVSIEAAEASSAKHPEAMAKVTDSLITALYDVEPPFGGAFAAARVTPGVDPDLVSLGLLLAATGLEFNPKTGMTNADLAKFRA